MRLQQHCGEPLFVGGEPGGFTGHGFAPRQLPAAMACSIAFWALA